MGRERVLSGMQASGKVHIGNLVGALKNWVDLQDKYDCFYFVADWHALTTGYADPSTIKESTKDLLINFIAAGLDPDKATIFIQSMVPQHAELHLLLSMITPLGWLERVPTYKEKQEQLKDRDLSTYGFLGYPVLQTADIIIYRAKHVPVGIDQFPHLEISREIARRFNYLYNRAIFPEPEGLLTQFPKVPGLDGRKMSKSYDNAVYLSDSPEIVEQKIRTMMTDPARKRKTDKGEPELSPVYHLHKIFSSKEELDIVTHGCRTAEIGCIDCKKILIKNVFAYLEPIWKKRTELISNPEMVLEIAKKGSEKAGQTAEETMKLVREAMGLS
ncbi:MAG: tryptophan--tRNA ligase [Nitrospirae bacterium GWB2_47_37]|nr:MAG: tryptophan--tRNA ligase [Nitrospirae bacterium GWA2_46_11]OGW23547.1 MAG: tryptophan--tRNA ligase [Nitrospirae bacterium GWB2_47_37]HAK88958.1 tryptophan--tRNA ligase [Nitrospiraceae bacterium]